MTTPTGQVTPPSDGFEQRLRSYEKRLAALEQRGAQRLGRTSVVDPDANESFYIGPDAGGSIRDDGQIPWRMQMARDGGAPIVQTKTTKTTDDGTFRQYWALNDSKGRTIVSDDAYTGEGMATPWLPFQMLPQFSMAALAFWDYMTLDAGVLHQEKNIWEGFIPRVSHPKCAIRMVTGYGSGSISTPAYRILVNGVQRDSWTAGPGVGAQIRTFSIQDLLDSTWVQVQIKVIVATGTGVSIAVHCSGAAQRQS
jgi:hypothetical protein